MRILELCGVALGVAALAVAVSPPAAAAEPDTSNKSQRRDGEAYANPFAVHDFLVWHQGVVAGEAAVKAEEERLWARWGPVHDCEQPGDWYAAGRTRDGYFEGGLGIERSLYRDIRGHSALQDSPVDQMRVAEVVLGRYGPSAWGCDVPM